ncbi:MAG: protein kinase domain-containing protein [Vicinamibacterales bacterium]
METVGRYRIVRRLGEGGMGVVYEAHDDRLDRVVALKLMHDAMLGPVAVERFWREARAAASISHPHICQIFELGEDEGRPFIVMERLAGETLADRLARGPIAPRDAAALALGLLDALEALHQRQVVHRDLKPSNVFITAHGIKLLDFGLARDVGSITDTAVTRLTSPGLVVGTPHYMPPEQITGTTLDERADLFAAGAIFFEMLSGHPAFPGATPVDVLQKILHEQPPALLGSPLVAALDAIIHRALAKRPDTRYPTAAAMAADVRQALAVGDSGEAVRVTTMTRLVVLPFRLLRADPDTEFLAFSLPDAITASLSQHEGISVRSPLAASRFASDAPDLRAMAEQLDVDHVLTGTLLRSGDQLRISVQLVQAPGGRVIWSHGAQAAMGDLFQLQDTLTHGIVDALPVGRVASAPVDVPRTPRAYELYLRANQLALESSTYRLAQSLYERCLDEDPRFAPAWARLGRVQRVIGKYLEKDPQPADDAAEHAFRRALELNPDLPIAHNLYSYLETERGRAELAMTRVLDRLGRHPADAELLAALVHSCRYCGLLDASIAAHERARRLDPQVRTSVLHTYFAMGDYQRCVDEAQWLTDPMITAALVAMGRTDEARIAIRLESERFAGNTIERHFITHLVAFVGGTREDGVRELDLLTGGGFRDGEGIYHGVRGYARLGEIERAIRAFEQVIEFGFFCYPAFARDPWLDPIRSHPRFVALMRVAETHCATVARLFVEHRGDRLLGVRH